MGGGADHGAEERSLGFDLIEAGVIPVVCPHAFVQLCSDVLATRVKPRIIHKKNKIKS